MPLLRPTSSPARTSLAYMTIGCLMLVWTGVWYIYLLNHTPSAPGVFYVDAGLALTGFVLVVLGLAVGQIGRSARHAEASSAAIVPPTSGTPSAEPPVIVVQPQAQQPTAQSARQALGTTGLPTSNVVRTSP
jgi:hypothetical protein